MFRLPRNLLEMKPNDTRSRVAIGLCVLRVASTTTGRLVPTHEGLPQDQEDRDPADIRKMVPQLSSWQGNMPEIILLLLL